MEHWWSDNDRGTTEVLGENRVPLLLCRKQISHGLSWDQISAPAMKIQRITTRDLVPLCTVWSSW